MLLIATLIDFYSFVVLVTAILSWLPMDSRHPVMTTLRALTEPVLAPIRRRLPPMGGFDWSPLVLILALQLLKRLLLSMTYY